MERKNAFITGVKTMGSVDFEEFAQEYSDLLYSRVKNRNTLYFLMDNDRKFEIIPLLMLKDEPNNYSGYVNLLFMQNNTGETFFQWALSNMREVTLT